MPTRGDGAQFAHPFSGPRIHDVQPVAGEAVLSDEHGQGIGGSVVAALNIVARGRAAEDERAHGIILSPHSRCALIQVKAEPASADDLSSEGDFS